MQKDISILCFAFMLVQCFINYNYNSIPKFQVEVVIRIESIFCFYKLKLRELNNLGIFYPTLSCVGITMALPTQYFPLLYIFRVV